MVRIPDVHFPLNGKEYVIHGGLAEVLNRCFKLMKKDDDTVILIVGPERVGKSKLRDLIGGYWQYLTKTKFNVDNIHFTSKEYMKFALFQKPYTFVSHDETRRDLNTMRSMSKSAVDFTNYLSECGDNNQVHCLLLPAFSDISKYVALWRTKLLIEVGKIKNKSTGEYDRGLFRIIKTKSKKKLTYYHKNKYTKFPKSMVAFSGRFKDNDVIPTDIYKAKKQQFKESKYIEEEKKEKAINVPTRLIPSLANKKPGELWEPGSKEYEMGRKWLYSLRKAGNPESG